VGVSKVFLTDVGIRWPPTHSNVMSPSAGSAFAISRFRWHGVSAASEAAVRNNMDPCNSALWASGFESAPCNSNILAPSVFDISDIVVSPVVESLITRTSQK
jgi:hypothetical protein